MLVTVMLRPQPTLVVVPNPTDIYVGGTASLSTTGGGGTGAVTYSLMAGPCSLSGSVLTGTGEGFCDVSATKAADSVYASTTSEYATVFVSLAPQSELVVVPAASSIHVGQSTTLSSTGGSGTGAVTYALTAGPCSVSGSTVTGMGAGVCLVTATKAADSTFSSATSAPAEVTVSLAPQTSCTLVTNPASVQPGQQVNLSVTGCPSTGTVTYTAIAIPQASTPYSAHETTAKVAPAPTVLSCPISGTVMTPTGGYGVCQVTATVAADSTYGAASSTKNVSVTPPPAPVPSLSDYAKALLVFVLLGAMNGHRRRAQV